MHYGFAARRLRQRRRPAGRAPIQSYSPWRNDALRCRFLEYFIWEIEAAKRYPNRFAVMGRIPLQDPKSVELLPRWKEPGMLGVRVTFNTPREHRHC